MEMASVFRSPGLTLATYLRCVLKRRVALLESPLCFPLLGFQIHLPVVTLVTHPEEGFRFSRMLPQRIPSSTEQQGKP